MYSVLACREADARGVHADAFSGSIFGPIEQKDDAFSNDRGGIEDMIFFPLDRFLPHRAIEDLARIRF